MESLGMCKVYINVCGITYLFHVCPPVRKIIHWIKPMDYLNVQAHNPWYRQRKGFAWDDIKRSNSHR